jgi:hypothetical protein
MMPQFPHVVKLMPPDSDGLYTWIFHPVTWCDRHVHTDTWEFYLQMQTNGADPTHADDVYVFSFLHEADAAQFALLYG